MDTTNHVKPRPIRRFNAGKIAWTFIFCVLGIITILPFLWMLSASFKKPLEIYDFPIQWIPTEPQVSNYIKIWNNPSYPFFRFFLNSVNVAFFSVIGCLFSARQRPMPSPRLNSRGATSYS